MVEVDSHIFKIVSVLIWTHLLEEWGYDNHFIPLIYVYWFMFPNSVICSVPLTKVEAIRKNMIALAGWIWQYLVGAWSDFRSQVYELLSNYIFICDFTALPVLTSTRETETTLYLSI